MRSPVTGIVTLLAPPARRDRRLHVAVHGAADRADHRAAVRQARRRRHRPRPALQGALEFGDQHRQAHPRSGEPVAGSDRVRPEAARGRRLRALPHQGRAALLSERRLDPGRQHPAHHALERGAAPRARRGHLHQRGARRPREADAAHPRSARPRGRRLRHRGRRRPDPPRRPAGAEQPGGLSAHEDGTRSAKPPSSARRAARRHRRSAPRPTARRR